EAKDYGLIDDIIINKSGLKG
ncbi:ATP-dependent Clp protease proteolytic subunit, partial [Escherichia coli]|nr:ATP-dependent Clp protease proteolytic subunit [Escherichia coli]